MVMYSVLRFTNENKSFRSKGGVSEHDANLDANSELWFTVMRFFW